MSKTSDQNTQPPMPRMSVNFLPTKKDSITSSTAAKRLSLDAKPSGSFFSLLASQRVARRFSEKINSRRAERRVQTEPTYRLEPAKKFEADAVKKIVSETMELRLRGIKYNPNLCALLSKVLAEEIKDKTKAMKFDRYKLVCLVTMGQKVDDAVRVASRCVWDPDKDGVASCSWSGADIFCTVVVFGVYHD